jgi:hypothetical protein
LAFTTFAAVSRAQGARWGMAVKTLWDELRDDGIVATALRITDNSENPQRNPHKNWNKTIRTCQTCHCAQSFHAGELR